MILVSFQILNSTYIKFLLLFIPIEESVSLHYNRTNQIQTHMFRCGQVHSGAHTHTHTRLVITYSERSYETGRMNCTIMHSRNTNINAIVSERDSRVDINIGAVIQCIRVQCVPTSCVFSSNSSILLLLLIIIIVIHSDFAFARQRARNRSRKFQGLLESIQQATKSKVSLFFMRDQHKLVLQKSLQS